MCENFHTKKQGPDEYDYIYGMEKINEYYDVDLDRTLVVKVESEGRIIKIALTGEYYSVDENCAVLEDDILTVLQNTTITQLDLKTFKRIVHKKIYECFFGCGLYKIKDFYILCGEVEIIKLDKDFKCVWSFSSSDIFVTKDDTLPFIIESDHIKLKDWQGNRYEIDFNGKLINCDMID